MEIRFKQWHISDLIKHLEAYKTEMGDLPVKMAIDEEGNGFSPLGQQGLDQHFLSSIEIGRNSLILYPYWVERS